jgi:hypothetical protein
MEFFIANGFNRGREKFTDTGSETGANNKFVPTTNHKQKIRN